MRVLRDWLLTAERAAVYLPSATAVVADLHLGYAEARRRAGEAVPEDRLEEQLVGLSSMMRTRQVRRLVVAGDLLEDSRCYRALAAFRAWLDRAGIELLAIVPGNHDAEWTGPFAAGLPLHREGFRLGDWQVIHGDGPVPEGPVIHGHQHPYLRWSPRGQAARPRYVDRRTVSPSIEGACYLVAPQRLILPAFSREAAGANVLQVARWRSYRCCAIAEDCLVDLGELGTLRARLAVAGQRSTPGGKDRGPATRASQ